MNVEKQYVVRALDTWAPTWPRRVTRHQEWHDNESTAADALLAAAGKPTDSPFISTFSFPRGHTKNGNLPRVDSLFIDFDFEDGDYDGNGDYDAWRRDLSHLLVRVRRVAQYLRENGRGGWRASLSGHKGVHLFLDFPPLSTELGTFRQYVNGINDYATDVIHELSEATGIDDLHRYVDVTSSDLGRLCRVPNTMHGGATDSLGDERYCVPVTIGELAAIDVDAYEEYTSAPRTGPLDGRDPNPDVADAIEDYVRVASETSAYGSNRSSTTLNWDRVSAYREQSNDDITLDDIKFLTSDRPCVWRFYERDDKWEYGHQSHYMEMFCIRELIEKDVPIDVMLEFLDSAPGFDEQYSERFIKQIIARDYNRFSIEALLQNAPEFCGYDDCALCQRVLAEQQTPNDV